MSGSVDDVDFDAFPDYRAVFCSDRDAAFALKIHVVHDSVVYDLAFAEYAALLEHRVNKCGFAVVNVSDYRHVPDFVVSY